MSGVERVIVLCSLGFLVGTTLFHVTNTVSALISIEAKVTRIERTLKESK